MFFTGFTAGRLLIDHPFKGMLTGRIDHSAFLLLRVASGAFLMLFTGLTAGRLLIDHPFIGMICMLDCQPAEFLSHFIVFRFGGAPVDDICVVCASDLGLCTGRADCHNLPGHQPLDRRFFFRERLTVILLGCGAGLYDHRPLLNRINTVLYSDCVVRICRLVDNRCYCVLARVLAFRAHILDADEILADPIRDNEAGYFCRETGFRILLTVHLAAAIYADGDKGRFNC